ncbi:transposase [gut metagenome]|uniref:Transposase n=1 Tax=gut metagenome TaxID=749906 RepID=J9GAT3_9ZZZZ
MIIGALIIKHMLGSSDEGTILSIQENPYMQYLVGLKYFQEEPIFSPELFVTVRKRIDENFFNDIMLSMHRKQMKKMEASDKENDSAGGSHAASSQETTHKGKMKIDATCTDAEVRYPTDINILEDCSREIDRLTQKLSAKAAVVSPKTHRGEARSYFVRYTKKKHKGNTFTRETKKLLLHLLSQDIQRFTNFIGKLSTSVLSCLNRRDLRNFSALRTAYEQQKYMFDDNVRSCFKRIISIFQPHIRPIVRGKAGRKTEFGAKIGVSVVDGYTYIDHLSWEAYNECSDLLPQIQAYKDRFGYYPKEVQADKIYLNKENRKLLKKLNVICHCAPLGRPKKHPDPVETELRRKASGERNEVEATFGTAKRVYRANNIRAKLPETAATWIAACFFVKNLKKFLRGLLFLFFEIHLKLLQFFENCRSEAGQKPSCRIVQ